MKINLFFKNVFIKFASASFCCMISFNNISGKQADESSVLSYDVAKTCGDLSDSLNNKIMKVKIFHGLDHLRKHYYYKSIKYRITKNGCWECTSVAINKDGYPVTCINGYATTIARHICIDKHGLAMLGMVTRHKCDNKLCINPDHLEYGTTQENTKDRDIRGRGKFLKGEELPHAKLTEKQVIEIRNNKTLTQEELSKKYNVCRATIGYVKNGNIWKHLL